MKTAPAAIRSAVPGVSDRDVAGTRARATRPPE